VMRLKMRTWSGSVSISSTSSGLSMTAPTLTPHVNSEGERSSDCWEVWSLLMCAGSGEGGGCSCVKGIY
jgi:hypothetical protein